MRAVLWKIIRSFVRRPSVRARVRHCTNLINIQLEQVLIYFSALAGVRPSEQNVKQKERGREKEAKGLEMKTNGFVASQTRSSEETMGKIRSEAKLAANFVA